MVYIFNLFKKYKEKKAKNFILILTTQYFENNRVVGYGSHTYKSTSDPMVNFKKAIKLKEKLKLEYYDIEIIKVK